MLIPRLWSLLRPVPTLQVTVRIIELSQGFLEMVSRSRLSGMVKRSETVRSLGNFLLAVVNTARRPGFGDDDAVTYYRVAKSSAALTRFQ